MATLLERFETIKAVADRETENVRRMEARLDVKKEEVQTKKRALAEKGIEFKNATELRELITEKEGRVMELVVQMEDSLGISDEDEDDDDMLDDDPFGFED